ncbi:hypothetical protein NV379_14930 [Paenibacillus sp. N1-5-1-14]|uniref:hypothetical protein n=1 Tax=Paenibacillus radicibacter TaxID=2972488 RepID=UPI0021592207|nr:hypothetical protein [Paenibacillus radicibacter]MCR8643947.1 hypothetical protein [Paenibacillus radicibacter]
MLVRGKLGFNFTLLTRAAPFAFTKSVFMGSKTELQGIDTLAIIDQRTSEN